MRLDKHDHGGENGGITSTLPQSAWRQAGQRQQALGARLILQYPPQGRKRRHQTMVTSVLTILIVCHNLLKSYLVTMRRTR